jgi:5'-nucleotidase
MAAPIALVDLDGTLADYDGAMTRALEELRSPGEPPLVWSREAEPPWMAARRHLVARRPGFWRELEPLPVGFAVYEMLLDMEFEVHVVTKGPSSKSLAWMEKVEWCRAHVPDARVTITEDKSLAYGKVLVDDWPSYYVPWLRHRPRGLVVIPDQPWNADYVHPNCVRAAPHTLDRVKACLLAAKVRQDGAPLVLPD